MTGSRTGRPAPRAVATLVALTTVLGGCGLVGGGGDTYTLTAYFERAVSVFPSGDVRVLGLPVGTIQDVETEGNRVRVEVQVDSDVSLPADVQASIVPQSLIGERYVQLFPAWTEGPKAQDGDEIPVERTIVPVEPDEALAALKEFLDTLDPDGLGRLVDNLATDLEGNGATLNSALDNVSELVATFADKDEQLAAIVDHFDDLSATLVTRDRQLGEVLDAFGAATQVLAEERANLERFLASLASLAQNSLDLVAEHATELRSDIATVTRLVEGVNVNLGSVAALLDSGRFLVTGLQNAYNPAARALNLRNNFSPLAQTLLNQVLQSLLGDPTISVPCVPIPPLGTGCQTGEHLGSVVPVAAGDAVPVTVTAARSPIDDILGLLASPAPAGATPAGGDGRRSSASRVAGAAGDAAGFVGDAAASLLGIG